MKKKEVIEIENGEVNEEEIPEIVKPEPDIIEVSDKNKQLLKDLTARIDELNKNLNDIVIRRQSVMYAIINQSDSRGRGTYELNGNYDLVEKV